MLLRLKTNLTFLNDETAKALLSLFVAHCKQSNQSAPTTCIANQNSDLFYMIVISIALILKLRFEYCM